MKQRQHHGDGKRRRVAIHLQLDDWSRKLTRTNLALGVYPITVTDANGCEASTSYTVGEEGAITLNPSGMDVD
ncbi:MAG: hypothetical protein R2795_19495 [Saprospiraceae bacterium]